MSRRWFFTLVAFALSAPPAVAQISMDGTFMAAKECPAYQSIRKKTNPGNAAVAAGQSYRLIGKNKEAASHYLIEIAGASPRERWVAIDCGSLDGAAANMPPPQTADEEDSQSSQSKPRFVLAVSWQAAFCETRPSKTECETQTDARFDASHFTLHGLWPQPRRKAYCGVDQAMITADEGGLWSQLPEPAMTSQTRAELDKVMPGTKSYLHRHEWTKHGTCYPEAGADGYFADALLAVAAINASAAQALFSSHTGEKVTTREIRTAFDRSFGAGAGERVRVACVDDGGRRLISEITIGLVGTIAPGTQFRELILSSGPTDAGCPGGIVDPVGLQ